MAKRTKAPEQLSKRLTRLKELESIIEQDLDSWVRIGMALLEIRDQKLYNETHPTLEAWAKDRFSIARSRAYQLIDAVKIRDTLSTSVDRLPANEYQIRPLAKLEPELQVEAWKNAIEIAGEDEIADSHVKAAVRELNRRAKVKELSVVVAKAEAQEDGPFAGLGRFPVILADPPWRYDEGTADPSRKVENQYPTMALEDICALPVEEQLVTDDAVLFLWATAPLLPEALDVMDSWGFEYMTGAVWDKVKVGMGYWFRGRHEHLLIGARGVPPKPSPKSLSPSIVVSQRGRHSEKPSEVHKLIETYYPELPRVELFARAARPGWFVWGDESGALANEATA